MDEDRIQAVIHAAYEAALAPEGWSGLLERMAPLFRCQFADLFARREDYSEFCGIAVGLDRDDYEDVFLGTWVKRNVWGRKRPPRFSGEVVTTREMIDKSELVRTEMYNDYLAPRGLHEGLRLALSVSGGWVQDISLLRSWQAEPFADEELAAARVLLPHLQRAAAVAERLREAETHRAAGLAALEAVRHACLVLDGAGKLLFLNSAAEQLLADSRELRLGARGLTANDPAQSRALAALLARAGCLRGAASGHLRLGGEGGRAGLLLLAMPVGGGEREPFALRVPATVLLISNPDAEADGLDDQLATLFGLTGAEANLASDLLAGHSLAAIAELRGRSINTVRTHLARLMAKTGTTRQGALMRELMGAARLRVSPIAAPLRHVRRVQAGS